MKTVETIDNIILQPNWVLIGFDYDEFLSDVKTMKSGLRIDARFEKYEYAVVQGKVAKVCSELFYADTKGDLHEAPLEYDTVIEIEQGDEVYFNFLSAEKAVSVGRVVRCGDDYYIIIRYDRLYAAIRGGEWVGVNGWKIVEPIAQELKTVGFEMAKRTSNKGIVIADSHKVKHYWDKEYQETGWVKKGDTITYNHATPIENPIFKQRNINYVRVQERDILKSDKISPYVLQITPTTREMLFNVNQTVYSGIITDAENKELIGKEICYPSQLKVQSGDDVFLSPVHEVMSFNGQNLAI